MIKFFLTVSIGIWNCFAFGQGVMVASDSSFIKFPNGVNIPVSVNTTHRIKVFSLSPRAFKTWIAQSRYCSEMSATQSDAISLLKAELVTKDSLAALSRDIATAERGRAELYRSSYEELKAISQTYHANTSDMIKEMERLSSVNRRSKRKSFFRGLLIGVSLGILTGGVLFAM